ncbi:MAG: DNA translocase FtsK [Chloroflexota bacterium]
MAGKKSRNKEKARGKPWWYRPLRIFIGALIIVAVLAWQWQAIVAWSNNTASSMGQTFGIGLVLIDFCLGFLVVIVWRRKLSSLIHRWNWYLGGIVFVVAVWGILGFFNLGGNIGLGIIDSRSFIGALRLTGLILVGLIIIFPKASLHLVSKFLSWLDQKVGKKEAAPRPVRPAKPLSSISKPSVPQTSIPESPEAAEAASKEPKEKAPAQAATLSGPQQLKQVAQEVWKKYGETSELVIVDGWRLPPIDILEKSPEVEFSQADNVQRAKLLEEALGSYGVEAKVVQINTGPTVTQFGVEPGWDRKFKDIKEKDKDGNVTVKQEEISKTRVKVERITSLANDLALALAASSIRIEAPVPGKAIVGVEVPNTISTVVSLRGVIETSSFQRTQSRSKLALALGKGAGGEAVSADLAKMPHLLIAGATGSGKTVCLNTIISCLLMYNTPYDVQFIMIDPKRVELVSFNTIPHLAVPVIVESEKALEALRWLNKEMDKRYQRMAMASVRNIETFNKTRQGTEKMSYLVLVIDELADLMMLGGDEVERILCRLAQLARAVGIHLVVATQRPSVDVITGLIKANFPTRISFAVTSQVDSRTILDGAGAEKLLGKGDMLFMPTEAAKPKRLQGCYLSDPEIERLVYFWGSQKRAEAPSLKLEDLTAPATTASARRDTIPEDPLLTEARQLAKEHSKISTSFLQRKLRIGYPRAARLMEDLEAEGVKREEGEEGTAD